MATTDRPNPVSRDDSGLWMKMDFDPVPDKTEVTQCDLLPSGGTLKAPPDQSTLPPAGITRYYHMDDEGADDVFILPPPPPLPPGMAPPPPAGGVSGVLDASAPDPRVMIVSASVTEAKENPKGLKRHSVEMQSTAVQNIPEDTAGKETQAATPSRTEDADSAPSTNQVTLERPSVLAVGKTSRWEDRDTDKESEDIAMVTEESYALEDNGECPDETPSNVGESSGKKTDENGQTSADFMGESDDVGCPASEEKPTTQVTDTKKVTCGHSEVCYSNRNHADTVEVASDDEGHVDPRPLQYNFTKEAWVRRDSANSDVHLPRIPTPRSSSAVLSPQTKELEGQEEAPEKQADTKEHMSTETATDIQQDEQLLHRLELIQQRQGGQQVSPPSLQVATETANRRAGLGETTRCVSGMEAEDVEGGDLKNNVCRFLTDKVEAGTTNQGIEEREDGSPTAGAGETVKRFPPTMSANPSLRRLPATEVDNSDDGQSDSGVSADSSPVGSQDTTSKPSLLPASHYHQHQPQTCMEPSQGSLTTQSLQRARGHFNLADDPDVPEIPFQVSVLPDPHQLSEQRMQREMSQGTPRELAVVLGSYIKGSEARQMKDTKLLFQAFHQEETEGTIGHGRMSCRGRIHLSVLERTRSLETMSVKGSPVSRTQSMRTDRLTTEREWSPLRARSKSPAAGGMPPYPKQQQCLRLFKSMDSLNVDIKCSRQQTKLSQRSSREESAVLQENPFVKLRPALGLKPDVEKDIQQARAREEELRRQRCTLYGDNRESTTEEDSGITTDTEPDIRQKSKGKLDRIWPPLSKKDHLNSEQKQEPKLQKDGQKTLLWQRWEAGMTNRQPLNENN